MTPAAPSPPYDAFVCVSPGHADRAAQALRSLRLFAGCRHIHVAAAAPVLERLAAQLPDPAWGVRWHDEDRLLPGLTLAALADELRQRCGSDRRAGWYFQQFLKLHAGASLGDDEHLLLWDSDTLLLRRMRFFDAEGRVLVTTRDRLHAPYFDTLQRLLGLQRQVPWSFVTEHMMLRRAMVKRLLDAIVAHAGTGRPWTEAVLDAVDPPRLAGIGFSEFETYGNFVAAHDMGNFARHEPRHTRSGTLLFGQQPQAHDVFGLMRAGYAWVTFESYMKPDEGTVSSNRAKASGLWDDPAQPAHTRELATLIAG